MVWQTMASPEGEAYYYDTETGESTWEVPLELAQPPPPPPPTWEAGVDPMSAVDERSPPPGGEEARDERSGSVKQKIDDAFKYIAPCCLRAVDPLTGPCAKCGWLRTFCGSVFYGVAFVPFVFALLQQANMDRIALDPFAPEGTPLCRAWLAGVVFLAAVCLYCFFALTVLDEEAWYTPGSPQLTLLLGGVVLFVWIQQALTLRYILLRPELGVLVKNRFRKVKLCKGRVSTSFDPTNKVNFIYLTVIVAEFFLFASVCFHPKMPWRQNGATFDDFPLVEGLQTFLPEALTGGLATGVRGADGLIQGVTVALLVILLFIVAGYLILLGDIVYQSRPPLSATSAVACELVAGALFTTVTGRLLLIAGNLEPDMHVARMVAMLFFFLFATTATFVAVMRYQKDSVNTRRRLPASDIRFLPK